MQTKEYLEKAGNYKLGKINDIYKLYNELKKQAYLDCGQEDWSTVLAILGIYVAGLEEGRKIDMEIF